MSQPGLWLGSPSTTGVRLRLHDAAVSENFGRSRPVRQQFQFLGRTGLELVAVFDD